MDDKMQIFLTMLAYMLVVIGIGVFFYKKAQSNTENYFLGGRSLGPWVAAMSAEASDMSGWLLMGLPGLAFFCGTAEAAWTAIGLGVGTYINWLIVARRLRGYSKVAGDSITVPDFLSNRFKENKKVILGIAAVFILVFFTVYAASCFVTCGKLFSTLFDFPYHYMMLAGALFVVIYTLIGGFLAESVSDFMQAIVMIIALVTVLVIGTIAAGGIGAVIDNANEIDGFLSFFTTQASKDANGEALVIKSVSDYGQSVDFGALTIVSTLAWGLGYFGVPQVLLRFMAIRKASEIRRSRIIATVWCWISLFAAVAIGVVGRAYFKTTETLTTASQAENVFSELSQGLLPPILAGIVMAGILAATISSSDSYLLIAASAVSKNIYEGIIRKTAKDKEVMWVSRIVLVIIAIVGVIIAWNENSIIFRLVSFAWAGFGATFGPIILFSLFWKRTTRAGAVAGILSGAVSVFVWKLVLNPLGGIFTIYELLPAFIISSIAIVVVSLLTKKPSNDIIEEFELAKNYKD